MIDINKGRYIPEDFRQSRFAAVKNSDGTVSYFFRPRSSESGSWFSEYMTIHTTKDLIADGAFPVFAEPYSPEAFRFAWDRAYIPTLEEVESTDGDFRGVAMTLEDDGSFTVKSDVSLEYFTPRERFLCMPSVVTRSGEIRKLLEERVPHLMSPEIDQLAQAIVDLEYEIMDILED